MPVESVHRLISFKTMKIHNKLGMMLVLHCYVNMKGSVRVRVCALRKGKAITPAECFTTLHTVTSHPVDALFIGVGQKWKNP